MKEKEGTGAITDSAVFSKEEENSRPRPNPKPDLVPGPDLGLALSQCRQLSGVCELD